LSFEPIINFAVIAIAYYSIKPSEPWFHLDFPNHIYTFTYGFNPLNLPLYTDFIDFGYNFGSFYNLAIPFIAVSATVIFMFLLLPWLSKIPYSKRKIIISVAAVLIFCGLELYSERVAAIGPALHDMFTSRYVWTYEYDLYRQLVAEIRTPFVIRIHYFIFSIVLVLAVIHWLYGFAETRYGSGKPGAKHLIIHGVVTVCYLIAFVWVRVENFYDMDSHTYYLGQITIFPKEYFSILSSYWFAYDYYDYTLYVKWESVVTMGLFFALTGIATGLFSALHIYSKKRVWVSPCIGMATVVISYAIQFILYGRRRVHYVETGFDWIMNHSYEDIWVANEASPEIVGFLPPVQIAFIALSGVIVFVIVKLVLYMKSADGGTIHSSLQ
jgi:hypothetical protein